MRSKTISAALVSGALNDDEEQDLAEPVIATSEAPKRAPAATAVDIPAIVAAVVAAMQQSGAASAESIAQTMKQAAQEARQPIPEGTDASNPRRSVYNPEGESVQPLPPLECDTFWGVYDDEGRMAPAFEMINLKRTEIVGLNALPQGEFTVRRTDEKKGQVKVQIRRDENGAPKKKIVAVPVGWFSRDQFQQVPSILNLCKQITDTLPGAA